MENNANRIELGGFGTLLFVVYGLPWREFTKDRLDVESLNAHDI